ncbi:predicted protein [Naegleria gruberi]|uniref:Predicted protein n=1 Tax=Naegleria gruberi TaxID=5762 RepID=D2VHT9_NAEGR|nr:uncharacterized protein NAEGRDRAFT_68444 [Naegleria gruberi]EFC43733.1 predicted protein [Naegleria gruberi]|eukprot:XP_002676477.1 predicted protein [Naegleria gruberi strain NEG-M]
MAHRDDDEEQGYESNVYNPDHCLLDHDAVFGMIEDDINEERMVSMENYENNPRDDIPGPISFLLRGSNSGSNHLTHHHTLTATQQRQPLNAKKQRKPTLHEMENWKEMKSIVEQRGQTKFLTSLEKIQNNRSTTSKEKIPLLPVIIRQILHYDSNESAHVLFGELESDTEIEGTISKKAIEKNTNILTVGTVVLLKKIQIYCPKPLKFHLIISEKNTAKVWVSENEENSMLVDNNRSNKHERNGDEFTFDRNIDSLDEFTPTRFLNQHKDEEEEETLSSQPVIMKQFNPPPVQQSKPISQHQPPPTTGKTTFIKPKPPTFSTPQQQDNPFSSKFKPVETPQITLDDDSNLDLSQPFTTPRTNYAASPEVVSTHKRKVDSISSQNSLNDSGGKRRKSPLDEESALLKDSFNDPLFDDSSNHSLSVPSSPPLINNSDQLDNQQQLETPKPAGNIIVPPFTPPIFNKTPPLATSTPTNNLASLNLSGISNLSSQKSVTNTKQVVPSSNPFTNNNKMSTKSSSSNTTAATSNPPKKTVLFHDDDDDPLAGILDGEDLFPSNLSSKSTSSLSSSSSGNITAPTTIPNKQTSTVASTTTFKPPPPQQQVQQKANLPSSTTTTRKQLIDDDDDLLAGILGDGGESLFNDSPLVKPSKQTSTVATTFKKPQQQAPPKKKTIQYDDDF